MIIKKKMQLMAVIFFCLSAAAGTAACTGTEEPDAAETNTESIERTENTEHIDTAVGLILTSRDDEENEAVLASMEELAVEKDFRLVVYTPDVSAEEAEEAAKLEQGSFASCDVDPIEYQMLGVNELVAEDVDVIALHPNHSEALESVLGAARGVGIQVCAWECPVTEESFDVYVEGAAEVPAAVQELLEAEIIAGSLGRAFGRCIRK